MKLENVSMFYKEKIMFKDVNLTFNNTGLVLIKGSNGSGKTTLLNLVSKLIKPSDGSVILNNDVVYVSYSSNLLNDYNILDNMKLFCELYYIDFDKSRCDYYFSYLNLDSLYTMFPQGLSSGQLSRVLLILGLLLNKSIILIDEITSNLDEDNIVLVESLLKREKSDKLIFFISHNNVLLKDIDMVLELKEEKILVDNISYSDNNCLNDSDYKMVNIGLLYKLIFKSNIFFKTLISSIIIGLIFNIMSFNYIKLCGFEINNIKIYGFILIGLNLWNHIFDVLKCIKRKIGCFKYIGISKISIFIVILLRCIIMGIYTYISSLFINRLLVDSINDILELSILDYEYFIGIDFLYLFLIICLIYFYQIAYMLLNNVVDIKEE